MEEKGSADDPGAPDSWETADLDASMTRLLLSSKGSASSPPPPEAVEDAEPLVTLRVSPAAVERAGSVLVDAVIQVDQFLREALDMPRERLKILRMEQDIEKFIRDPSRQQLEFQALPNSYLRLAAHRVAQHYYLQSVAIQDNSIPEGSGSRILLCKTSINCRMPPVRLADIPVNLLQEDSNFVSKVEIKQRPQKHSQIMSNANTHSFRTNHPKSVEERKEEYNRARARIFNSTDSSSTISDLQDEVKLPDNNLQDCSFVSVRPDEQSVVEESEYYLRRSFSDSSAGSAGSSRLNRTKRDKEPIVSRHKASNRIAIFRDHEVDSKDPDYDRSYERYMQRFDPGFGFSGGPCTIQPLYSPAVNYNTEFPQHRGKIPMDHRPWPIPQHLHGPWLSPSTATAVNYGPPEVMMPSFNSSHVHGHSTTSVYVHSSQYLVPPRPGMPFAHPNGRIQTFTQTHPQQPDASFGLARPH